MTDQPSRWVLIVLVGLASVDPELLFGASMHRALSLGLSVALVGLLIQRTNSPNSPTSLEQLRETWLRRPLRWLALWLLWASIVAGFSGVGPVADTAVFVAVAVGVSDRVRDGGLVAVYRVLAGSLAVAGTLSVVARIVGLSDLADDGRLRFLFLEPNQLARAVAVTAFAALCVLLASLDGPQERRIDVVALATLVATLVMLFATQSRTGTLAMVSAVAVLGAFLLPRKLVAAGFAIVLAAVVLVSLADRWGGVAEIVTRDEVGDVAELGTFNGRTVLWPDVIAEARKRPMTGFGLGSDRALIGSFQVRGNLVWNPEHTHNWLLQLWLTSGLLGAILVVLAVLDALRMQMSRRMQMSLRMQVSLRMQMSRRMQTMERPFVLGLLLLLVVDGISEPVMRVPDFGFVALVGLLTLCVRRPNCQLSEPKTVETSSSISSTARS